MALAFSSRAIPVVGVRFLQSAIFCLVVGISTGCGYQFQGSGTILPQDIKTVAIAPVDNETTESGLGIQFREALRSRFERYGAVKVVDTPERADAVLSSKIESVNTRVRAVTGTTDIAVAQELYITISADLKRKNGQLLWKNGNLEAHQSFAETGGAVVTGGSQFAQGGIGTTQLGTLDDLQVSRGQKEQALSDLVDEAARKLYLDAVAEDF